MYIYMYIYICIYIYMYIYICKVVFFKVIYNIKVTFDLSIDNLAAFTH